MKVENTPCVFLLAQAPYSYEFKETGKKGVSLKLKIAIDGEAYPVKVTERQYEELKNIVNTPGVGSFKIAIFDDKIQLSLIDFSLNSGN